MGVIAEFEHVTFRYPEAPALSLEDICFQLENGSFTAVVGHNGSGKSTLARHMNGLLLPTEGRVFIDGIPTTDEARILDIRRTVGLVFQNPDNQIVSNVVEEDVAFAPENLGVPSAEIRKRVNESLRLVGMEEYSLHAPHLLSGGQKQRVAIAGVLAMQPKLLVLDEPTAMLDPKGRHEVLEIVTRLCREEGMTVLLVTHHMEECLNADRILVMSRGRLVDDGNPLQVFSHMDFLVEKGLDVPETVRLTEELKQFGYNLNPKAYDAESCAACIAEEILRRRMNTGRQTEREYPEERGGEIRDG